MRHAVAWLVGVAVTSGLACSSFTGSSAPAPSANDAGAVDAGTVCPIVFVAPTGDDGRDGCDQAAPMKTVAAAISKAKANAAKTVQICAGVYDEQSLVLDAPISLRGGYDCTTWQRPNGFGFPTFANGAVETRITRMGASASANTLAITGAGIGHDVEVEGITVFGPDQGTAGIAIAVVGGASPSIHDVSVRGGATTGTSTAPGSIGIAVIQNSRPEIMRDRIDGGLGTSMDDSQLSIGTVGLEISSAVPLVHDDIIDGGSSAAQSFGVLVGGSTMTGDNALARLHVTTTGARYLGVGVVITGSTVDLVDSVIDIARVACDAAHTCDAEGVRIADTSTAHVSRNRIAGADIAGGLSGTYGVLVVKSTGVIDNNQIFAGNSFVQTGTTAFGIGLVDAPTVSILYNTIDGGPSSNAFDIAMHNTSTDAIIAGNLLLTTGAAATGIFKGNCEGSTIAHADNNAFVSPNPLTITQDDACKNPPAAIATTSVEGADYQLVGMATNSFKLAPNCSGVVRCYPVTCPTSDTCAAPLFQAPGLARATLVATGWHLAPTIACPLVNGPVDSAVTVGTDVFGQLRKAPFTIGAEQTSACQ